MNKKVFILLLFALAFNSTVSFAQGLFSGVSQTETTETPAKGGMLARDITPPGGTPENPGETGAIGEGLLVLSFLSGAYALVKNRKNRKNA